jgi:hypothetical protein
MGFKWEHDISMFKFIPVTARTCLMKRVSKVLVGVAAIASLSFLAPSYSAAPVIPTACMGISGIFQVAEMQFVGVP